MQPDPSPQPPSSGPANEGLNPLLQSATPSSPESRFSALMDYGHSLLSQGDLVNAERTLRSALAIAGETLDRLDPNRIRALEDTAHCLVLNKKEDYASNLYLELSEIAAECPKKYAQQGESSAINLTLINIILEEYDTAEEWARKAVATAESSDEMNEWVAPSRLALGLVLQIKGQSDLSEQSISDAFGALEKLNGSKQIQIVAKHLTQLGSVFADQLEFNHALACINSILKVADGEDTQSRQIRLGALAERARIELRRGDIKHSYDTEKTVIDIAIRHGIPNSALFRQNLSLARKKIELGAFDEGDVALQNLYTQGVQYNVSPHLLRSIRTTLARSQFSQGHLDKANETVRKTIREIMDFLPKEIRTMIESPPEQVRDQLLDAMMNIRSSEGRSNTVKALDQLVPLIALEWQIARHRSGNEAPPSRIELCHSLTDILRKEGVPGNLEYFKMIFIDQLGPVDRLEQLNALLTEKRRANSREELGLRIAAAIENREVGQSEEGLAQIERAKKLYETLIAESDSLHNAEITVFYSSALAEFGENDRAVNALQHAYQLFLNSSLAEGPEYLELLDQLALRYEELDPALAEDVQAEANSMRERLSRMNPGYSFERS